MNQPLVCVIAGRGNLGASTLTLHLAGALGGCAVDAHLFGGLDVLAGIEDRPGPRWNHLDAASNDVDANGVIENVPRWWRVPVIAGVRMRPDHTRQPIVPVVQAMRGQIPVVVDLPAELLDRSDEHDLVAAADWLVWLAGRDVASAMRTRALAAQLDSRAIVAVRCDRTMSLAVADVVGAIDVPLGAVIAHTPGLSKACESGVGPSTGRPQWQRAGRRDRAAPVGVAAAATRLAMMITERS